FQRGMRGQLLCVIGRSPPHQDNFPRYALDAKVADQSAGFLTDHALDPCHEQLSCVRNCLKFHNCPPCPLWIPAQIFSSHSPVNWNVATGTTPSSVCQVID